MSADNYIYVAKLSSGGYGVGMAFASDDNPDFERAPTRYPDVRDAVKAAYRMERAEEVVEYGVQIVGDAWDDYLAAP